MIKAYCREKGIKLERFADTNHLVDPDVDMQLKVVGQRYYPQDLQNLIEFIRKNCTALGFESRTDARAAT